MAGIPEIPVHYIVLWLTLVDQSEPVAESYRQDGAALHLWHTEARHQDGKQGSGPGGEMMRGCGWDYSSGAEKSASGTIS